MVFCAASASIVGFPALAFAQSSIIGEADQGVSLSADKIIEILRRETGLLLQVKRMLVRRAYEQGRILEPADLTDDALFRLLRENDDARVIATREIEARYYVRAKPTRQELQQEPTLAQAPAVARTSKSEDGSGAGAPGSAKRARSQEDAWGLQQIEEAFESAGGGSDRSRLAESSELLSVKSVGGGGLTGLAGSSPNRVESLLPPVDVLSPSLPVPALGMESASRMLAKPQPARGENPRLPPLTDSDSDRLVLRHHPNPYARVPSLYDIYAQVSEQAPVLERFGMSVFRNGTGNLDDLPMDLPAGPDYVLGPGDGLSIELWGSVAQRLQRLVDREGRVALPEAGTVQVSGRSLGEVQRLVQSALRTQFRDIEADVSLARIRSVRVYVVGDVGSPGAYDISSLSTPLNALYAAGGPTARGSLRHLRHYRGQQLLEETDAYDLLLHGIHRELVRIQSGDTILVPPIGPEITVAGMVRRPAIYELNQEKTLAEALELAGGVLPSGALRHVDVERLVAHEKRTMLRLDLPESNDEQAVNQALEEFQVQDGDQVRISPILPYAEQAVYLDGHVFYPGKYPYREGMKVTDILRSHDDLLPEPARSYAELIRLQPPDYTPVVLAFNLAEAMEGKEQNLGLKPFDTLRIFGRYDFEDPPTLTITGEVRHPGEHVTNGVTRLRDALYLAGGVSPDAELSDAQVFRRTGAHELKVISVNLSRALAGEERDNILLAPKDHVIVHRSPAQADPRRVTIQGEVSKPGKYPLGEGMSAADLVRLAGGLRRGAYTEAADLTRYAITDGKKVVGEHLAIPLAAVLSGVADSDVRLRDGDVLTVGELAGWQDVGATITVKGEVLHPGMYGIREGERLSSILERAGGLRADAYPYGAVLERAQVREMEEKNRADLIRRVQAEETELKLVSDTEADQKAAKQASLLQWQATLERLQNTPPVGRLVIHISSDVKRWANTAADIQVRAGDVLYIPKRSTFVMVAGAVYNPTAIAFRPGKSANWYLNQAGGATNTANKKAIFVIRADGSVVSDSSGSWFSGGMRSAALQPGDMVMVPEKAYGGSSKWKNTLQASQLVSAVGIAIQVAKGF